MSNNSNDNDAGGRILRHRAADRLYHWLLAGSVLTLLGTAFLPILGWKFAWLDAHWIAGVVLGVLVVFHIVRAVVWLDLKSMMIWPRDLYESWLAARYELGGGQPPPLPGKYPLMQRGYHAFIALIILALLVTGGLMMSKLDTPFWSRNPYWLSQSTWGIVYVVHDLAAMTALALIMIHIYFALRPENLWIARSMITGWITRKQYLAHHDPSRWQPDDGVRE